MFGPLTSYVTAGVAAFVLLAAFWGGYHMCDLQAKAQLAKELQMEQAARAKVEADLNTISGKYEAERTRTAQVQVDRVNTVREIYKDAPPPPSCAVPTPAFSVLLGAVQDANAAASGQSGGGVQSSAASTVAHP